MSLKVAEEVVVRNDFDRGELITGPATELLESSGVRANYPSGILRSEEWIITDLSS